MFFGPHRCDKEEKSPCPAGHRGVPADGDGRASRQRRWAAETHRLHQRQRRGNRRGLHGSRVSHGVPARLRVADPWGNGWGFSGRRRNWGSDRITRESEMVASYSGGPIKNIGFPWNNCPTWVIFGPFISGKPSIWACPNPKIAHLNPQN